MSVHHDVWKNNDSDSFYRKEDEDDVWFTVMKMNLLIRFKKKTLKADGSTCATI